MKNLKSVRTWLHGLGAAVIGGGATAGSSWVAMSAAKAAGIDVPDLNFKALGIICLTGGVSNALMYLKQSPLPKWDEEEDAGASATGNPS